MDRDDSSGPNKEAEGCTYFGLEHQGLVHQPLFQSFFPLVKAHRIARQAFNKQAIITLLERRHIFQNAQVTSNKLVHKKRHHFGKALKSCLS